MKRIPLTQGQFALVDDEWFDELSQWSWYAKFSPFTGTFYALRSVPLIGRRQTSEYMHRRITEFSWSKVDHSDHDTLNNQRENLRDGSRCNNQNRRPHAPGRFSSLYHGVHWETRGGKWRASIRVDNRLISLGYFDDEIEAALAYDNASRELHGEYGTRNFEEGAA